MSTTTAPTDPVNPPAAPPPPARRRGIGTVVAGSLALGLVTAAVSTLVVMPGATEPVVTGLLLVSFALGWLTLWRWAGHTDQPQDWARVPAGVLGAAGLAYLTVQPGDDAISAAGWVWPPLVLALVAWMVKQSLTTLRSWAKPVLLYPVFLALAVTAGGGLYETVQELGDDEVSRTGDLYGVAGHTMWLSCTGTGSPTVLLEAGLGESSTWMSAWIAPAVSHETRVCVYDRAGYGRSEPSDVPVSGQSTVSDLHALLAAAGEDGPFVVAGHSTGAVYALLFADAYPDDVVGVVLLDGQSPDVMTGLPAFPAFYATFRRVEALAPTFARFGVARLAAGLVGNDLPDPQGGESVAEWSTPLHYRTLRDEFAALPHALDAAHRAGPLGDTPLAVVTAEQGAQDGWLPLQDSLTDLSSDVVHVRLPDTTHASLVEDSGDASVAAGVITGLVEAVRTDVPVRTVIR